MPFGFTLSGLFCAHEFRTPKGIFMQISTISDFMVPKMRVQYNFFKFTSIDVIASYAFALEFTLCLNHSRRLVKLHCIVFGFVYVKIYYSYKFVRVHLRFCLFDGFSLRTVEVVIQRFELRNTLLY